LSPGYACTAWQMDHPHANAPPHCQLQQSLRSDLPPRCSVLPRGMLSTIQASCHATSTETAAELSPTEITTWYPRLVAGCAHTTRPLVSSLAGRPTIAAGLSQVTQWRLHWKHVASSPAARGRNKISHGRQPAPRGAQHTPRGGLRCTTEPLPPLPGFAADSLRPAAARTIRTCL
jgi:hypothetical protein